MESVERGMVLDDALYDPKLPREERGKNAWVRSAPVAMALGKRPRREGLSGNPGDTGNGRRKLRRTASTKLQSQNSELWTDIVGGGFDKKVVVTDARRDVVDVQEPEQQAEPRGETTNQREEEDASSIARRTADSQTRVGHENSTATETHNEGLFGEGIFYIQGFEPKKVQ